METVLASTLMRNDRVTLANDELPYLVDSVSKAAGGDTIVTYSSGDAITYGAEDEVTIIETTIDPYTY